MELLTIGATRCSYDAIVKDHGTDKILYTFNLQKNPFIEGITMDDI